jgi:hypothetical protein
MRRIAILGVAGGLAAGWLIVQACGSNTPTLPGQFLGTFFFTGTLVTDAGGGLVTTCQVAIPLPDGGSVQNGDGDGGADGGSIGAFFFPTSPQFYAQLSLLDGGEVVWELLGTTAADGGALLQMGPAQGGGFTVVTFTQALVSGCDCTAGLTETIALSAGDGGLVPGLSFLGGTIDDRLDPDAGLSADAGPVCVSDAGFGCQLGCDLIYVVTGVPGRP